MKIELGTFKVECDEYCVSFSDGRNESFLDIRDVPGLRSFIDGLDDYLNSKKPLDDDPLDVPLDLED